MPPLAPHPLAPPAPKPAPHGPTDAIAHAVTANPFAFKPQAPFRQAQQQAAQQTRQAANRVPSQPQLKRFPVLKSYTPAQAHTIVTQQSQRIHQVTQKSGLQDAYHNDLVANAKQWHKGAQQAALQSAYRNFVNGTPDAPSSALRPPSPTKTPVERLYAQSNASDRQQIALFQRLAKGQFDDQQQRTLHSVVGQGARLGMSPSQTLALSRERARLGAPSATSGLSEAGQALEPFALKAAAIPAALAQGVNALAQVRPLSDKNVLTRSINDLLTYPAAAIPTAYAAVTEPGKLASGIAQQVTHPVQTFEQHPLFAAMLAHGAVSGLGRTVGAVGRAAGADFASNVRPSLGLAGESGARVNLPRSYSKDVFRKAAQKIADERLSQVRDAQGNPVSDVRGRPVLAAKPRQAGKLMNQRADFLSSLANAVERNQRAVTSRDVQTVTPVRSHAGGRIGQVVGQAVDRSLMAQPTTRVRVLPKGFYRPEKDVVSMAMEGTLRGPETFRADLVKERQRLETAYRSEDLNPLQRSTNRSRARTIDRVLNDPRAMANAKGVFDSARKLATGGNTLERQAVEAGLLSQDAADRAKLFPYAQSHMGAKPVTHADGTTTLRAADGTFLSNEQIHAHMADPETGPVVTPDQIAYLPHRFDTRGARAYHQQFQLRRPNLNQESRTGSAYAKGATDTGMDLVQEHMVRQATTLARQHEFDRLINDVGIKHPDGRYFTWKEAQQYATYGGKAPNEATNELLPGEPALVPVRALPAKYDQARAESIQAGQDPSLPGAASRLVHDQTSRFLGPDPRDELARNVVLVPQRIADRLQENLRGSGQKTKGLQAASNAFRSTVLPFSTKWLTGNIAEGIGRLAIAGATPLDVGIGRRLIKDLVAHDAQAGEQVSSHLIGGLLYGEKGLTNRRSAADIGQTAGAIARAPVVRELGQTLRAITKPSFITNRFFEQRLQEAALGKYSRQQIQEFTGSWLKAVTAQKQALSDVAKGLTDTGAQQAAARYLDDTLGKYSRFSPNMRHVIQGYAPFLPWYLNSIRFVYRTLPFGHPLKTAALTQAEAAFQQDWQDQHKGIPSSLKTAIPSHGGFIDAARYTPFGFPGPVSAGDLSQAYGIPLPEISGPGLALLGLNPFGQTLKGPKTPANPKGQVQGAQQALVAGNELAESFVPGLAIARRLREGGHTAYDTSTVLSPQTKPPKPGQPQTSALNRVFNPMRPVYISPSRISAGTSGALPPGVSQAYLDSLKQQATREQKQASKGQLPPGISQAYLDSLKRQAAGTKP